jgi:metal-responsive CopG/Arc/MetJ family transcriptional regulator
MARQTKIVNLSLPLDIYNQADEIAKKRGVSRSAILKKALEVYIMQEKRWELIYKWGEEKAKELKIKDEEDVERLIQEFRKEYT